MRFVCVLAMFALVGCSRAVAPPSPQSVSEGPRAAPAAPSAVPVAVAATEGGVVVGAPRTFANLTVYPLLSKKQIDPGKVVTLEDALKSGAAEVREVDAVAAAEPVERHGRRLARSGAQVGTLVIENKGDDPVFVIAGTIVKGGNQDRQISQDFIIEGKKTVPVDAFCVEQGRWRGDREGASTGGRFGSTAIVATSKVRAAGQYKRDQSEVWQKVAETNAAHKKSAATGTLMATLDDAAIAKEREGLAKQIESFVNGVEPKTEVVGVAYAVDGQVRGARSFAHTKLFKMFETKLAQSIALEALTARAETSAAGKPAFAGASPPPAAVDGFMKEVDAQTAKEERDTAGANVNEYKSSARAYGSKTMMKPKAGAPAAAPTPISADYLAH